MNIIVDGYNVDRDKKEVTIDLNSPAGNIFAILAIAENIIGDSDYVKRRLDKAEVFEMKYEDLLKVIVEDIENAGYKVTFVEGMYECEK